MQRLIKNVKRWDTRFNIVYNEIRGSRSLSKKKQIKKKIRFEYSLALR